MKNDKVCIFAKYDLEKAINAWGIEKTRTVIHKVYKLTPTLKEYMLENFELLIVNIV